MASGILGNYGFFMRGEGVGWACLFLVHFVVVRGGVHCDVRTSVGRRGHVYFFVGNYGKVGNGVRELIQVNMVIVRLSTIDI